MKLVQAMAALLVLSWMTSLAWAEDLSDLELDAKIPLTGRMVPLADDGPAESESEPTDETALVDLPPAAQPETEDFPADFAEDTRASIAPKISDEEYVLNTVRSLQPQTPSVGQNVGCRQCEWMAFDRGTVDREEEAIGIDAMKQRSEEAGR